MVVIYIDDGIQWKENAVHPPKLRYQEEFRFMDATVVPPLELRRDEKDQIKLQETSRDI